MKVSLLQKKELGIEDGTAALTPLARMGRLVEQASSWDSFIWGAIGGGVMFAGRNGVTRILNGKAQQEAENKRATSIIMVFKILPQLLLILTVI